MFLLSYWIYFTFRCFYNRWITTVHVKASVTRVTEQHIVLEIIVFNVLHNNKILVNYITFEGMLDAVSRHVYVLCQTVCT